MLTFYARTDCATIWVFTVKWPDAKCKANTVPPAAIPAPPSQSIFAFPGKQHHCWKQTPSGSCFPVNCSILPRLSFGCLKVTLKSYTQTNMTAGIWFLYLFSEMKSLSFPSRLLLLLCEQLQVAESKASLLLSRVTVKCICLTWTVLVKVNGLFTSFPYIVHGQLFQAGVR